MFNHVLHICAVACSSADHARTLKLVGSQVRCQSHVDWLKHTDAQAVARPGEQTNTLPERHSPWPTNHLSVHQLSQQVRQQTCLNGSMTRSRYKPAMKGMTMRVRNASRPSLADVISHPCSSVIMACPPCVRCTRPCKRAAAATDAHMAYAPSTAQYKSWRSGACKVRSNALPASFKHILEQAQHSTNVTHVTC